jgi:phosphoenolpyruvate synthase/pyruvate phosphate dikinase
MFGLMDEVGEETFDSSLGCPLNTYEEATLNLIGGKALQCWRMMKYGLPVPSSFVVPTFVYSLHVEKAGVADLIEEVFGCDLRDPAVRETAKSKLDEIRKKILETPLMDEVVQNLEAWLDTAPANTTFAVRSSGSAEGKSFFFSAIFSFHVVSIISKCFSPCHASLFLTKRFGGPIVCWAI